MFVKSAVKNEEYSLKQNVFLVQLQTLLEVIEIFVQFLCLGSYRNDFVSSLLGLLSLEIFAGSNFCDFSSDPKKYVPANKYYHKHFPRKNYSRVNIL